MQRELASLYLVKIMEQDSLRILDSFVFFI